MTFVSGCQDHLITDDDLTETKDKLLQVSFCQKFIQATKVHQLIASELMKVHD